MQTIDNHFSEIERDIQPQDFRENSFWYNFVKDHGPGALIDLVNKAGGARLYILNHDSATKGARRRKRFEDYSL